MSNESSRQVKVGLLILLALAVFAAGIFLIGDRSNLFRAKSRYTAQFSTVSGLNEGNPVQLNGVDVGMIDRIVLPENPETSRILVALSVDKRYSQRIRSDSVARIRTLGLLGDKYIEVTSGSAGAEIIEPGGEIPAETSTAMDELVSSGEDVMANVTEISSSLRNILARMDRGEGLLGELVSDSEKGKKVTDSLIETMASVQEVALKIETGDGPLPRLINDATLANRLASSVERFDNLLAQAESGDGLLPSLLNDPASKERFDATLTSLQASAKELETFTTDLNQADGLVPKLLHDEEYGAQLTKELQDIVEKLNGVASKLSGGDGTVARLIEDPEVYDAINDIIVGVNESKLLRWLIRNRQKAGIKKRYEEAHETVD